MTTQITKEAREAAEKEITRAEHGSWIDSARGAFVQALIDTITQQHAEEMAKLKGDYANLSKLWDSTYKLLSERFELQCLSIQAPGFAAQKYDSLREQLRAKEQRISQLEFDVEFRSKELEKRNADKDRLKAELERVTNLNKDQGADLLNMRHAAESDNIVGSCNCLTKTPEVQYHKPGCKYRLISERDECERQFQAKTQEVLDEMNRADSLQRRVQVLEAALRAIFSYAEQGYPAPVRIRNQCVAALTPPTP